MIKGPIRIDLFYLLTILIINKFIKLNFTIIMKLNFTINTIIIKFVAVVA